MIISVSAKSFLPALAGVLLICPCLPAQPLPGAGILASKPVTWPFAGQPIPRFHAGMLLSYDMDFTTFRAFDYRGDGTLILQSRLNIPGAQAVSIKDIAARADGALAIAASAQAADGKSAAFIVWLSPGGKTTRAVRVSPFSPGKLAFQSDGSLWALGRTHDENFNDLPDYDLVRNYSPGGLLQRSALPRSTLLREGHTHQDLRLLVGSDRIVVVSYATGEAAELSLSGEIRSRFQLGLPSAAGSISGVAMTDKGVIFVSTARDSAKTIYEAVAVFRLDRSTGKLNSIDMKWGQTIEPGYLVGSDGASVVFYAKGRKPPELVWLNSLN